MPNLIHSLDASNIHLLTLKLTGQPLYTVHDCFATTANNMSQLNKLIKEAFIQIYFTDGNYLAPESALISTMALTELALAISRFDSTQSLLITSTRSAQSKASLT
jgi:DNA-dependent RNA polymerase